MTDPAKSFTTTFAVIACLLFVPLEAAAQQAGKTYRVGYLGGRVVNKDFRDGLAELGYIEGNNLVIEHRRYSRKRSDRGGARELVDLKVDVIYANSTSVALAAKKITRKIPVVFSSAVDPVVAGLVDSLARPGGNLTGLTHVAPDVAGKRLAILKEAFPHLTRVAVLWHPGNLGSEQLRNETKMATPRLGLQVYDMGVTRADQLEAAFRQAANAGSHAVLVTLSRLIHRNIKRISGLAIKYRLPAMYSDLRHGKSGGLMSYGSDRHKQHRRAAAFVASVLKGARPADMPVELPPQFDLVVNLKTARLMGLTFPPSILLRANRVIK